MRGLVILAALLSACAGLPAQEPDTLPAGRHDGVLAPELAREIAGLYNSRAALRATGPATVSVEQTVDGDVAVLTGPLTVRGEVRGRVLVINGNLLLGPTARITGDVIVVGGTITGQESGTIEGAVRWYPGRMLYSRDGERIVPERDGVDVADYIAWRISPGHDDQWRSRITIMSGGTYNRVEGLPILIGPSLRFRSERTRIAVDALGIMRSAQGFRWDGDNLGHDVLASVHLGERTGLTFSGRVFDVVRPVEAWHISDAEAGLASALVRRDYRDHYNMHGGSATVGVQPSRAMYVELEYSRENWRSREERDPFSLFRGGADWRPNPVVDAGRHRMARARFEWDTRNEPARVRTGWLVSAEVERGTGDATRLGPGHDVASTWETIPGDRLVPIDWTVGFLDVRRYLRVSPRGQLNLRGALGGWLGGDDLPLQRRLSVGGAGTLPGYNFRRPVGSDVLTCGGATLPGAPALCERVVLAQAEYRSDLIVGWGRGRPWHVEVDRPAAWVLFVNAGRGWLVEEATGDGIRYGASAIPPLRTFRTDLGGGIDLRWIGFYVAKSVTDREEPANFFLRLRQRF